MTSRLETGKPPTFFTVCTILLFSATESLVSDIPAGDGKTADIFFTVCTILYTPLFPFFRVCFAFKVLLFMPTLCAAVRSVEKDFPVGKTLPPTCGDITR